MKYAELTEITTKCEETGNTSSVLRFIKMKRKCRHISTYGIGWSRAGDVMIRHRRNKILNVGVIFGFDESSHVVYYFTIN